MLITIIGTMTFMIGMHETDQSWNMHILNIETGKDFYDVSMDGVHASNVLQLYNMGVSLTLGGFLLTIAGMIISTLEPIEKKAKLQPQEVDEFFK